MKSIIITLAWVAAWLAICVSFAGCRLTVTPDGSRTYSFDGEEAAKAIIIYAGK